MPWFHISQAVLDILSVLQVTGETFGLADVLSGSRVMSYDAVGSDVFQSPFVSGAFGMLLASSLVYLICSWFFGQLLSSDNSEGKSLINILCPPLFYKVKKVCF